VPPGRGGGPPSHGAVHCSWKNRENGKTSLSVRFPCHSTLPRALTHTRVLDAPSLCPFTHPATYPHSLTLPHSLCHSPLFGAPQVRRIYRGPPPGQAGPPAGPSFQPQTRPGAQHCALQHWGQHKPNLQPQLQQERWSFGSGLSLGFKSSASAPYNWSQDANQRLVMFGARDRGANVFVAYSNSPPWWMTFSRE